MIITPCLCFWPTGLFLEYLAEALFQSVTGFELGTFLVHLLQLRYLLFVEIVFIFHEDPTKSLQLIPTLLAHTSLYFPAAFRDRGS